VLSEADAPTALQWLKDEQVRTRAGLVLAPPQRARFADYAVSLMERKIANGDIKSAKGRERWRYTLEHLIAGTHSADDKVFVPGFGEFFIDMLRISRVEAWKQGIAELITRGDYSPATANGWLSILRVIAKAAKRGYELPHLFVEGVTDFDTSEHTTYTEEEPNALSVEQVPAFLRALFDLFPQHFAMTYLGFATGLRPSSLRPLRRKGPTPDVVWEKNRILVRRSQTVGDEVMETTKQKRRYPIDMPAEVTAVLRWHVDTQLAMPEQKESDLLFPSVTGGYRSPSVLNKVFDEVAREIGLTMRFTQRGMRRTFNDIARAAKIEGIVTRSISGHLTERMQLHYSTVNPTEQRASIARVIQLFGTDPRVLGGEDGGEGMSRSGEDARSGSA